jgi:hypothetical protein
VGGGGENDEKKGLGKSIRLSARVGEWCDKYQRSIRQKVGKEKERDKVKEI